MNKIAEKVYFSVPWHIRLVGVNFFEFYHSWLSFKSRQYKEWSKILLSSEKWDQEKLKSYQTRHFIKIINYAYRNVRFYRELFDREKIDVSSVKSLADLRKLPIIDKEQIRDNPTVFSNSGSYIIEHTSGTTGKPLTIRVSKEAYLLSLAAAYHGRRYRWAGYDGSYVARLVGDKPVKDCNEKKLYQISYITKRVIFPSYCLSSVNIKRILEILSKKKIRYLQAYPSTA